MCRSKFEFGVLGVEAGHLQSVARVGVNGIG